MTVLDLLNEVFWRHVDKTATPDGCWTWTGYIQPNGYGVLRIGYIWVKPHRLSWMPANGDLPEDKVILHRCDNPKCVRPDHLSAGTISDNVRDMVQKGRHGRTKARLANL